MTRNVQPLYSPARRHLSPPTGRRPPACPAASAGTPQTGAAPPESRFFSAAAASAEAALLKDPALFQSAQTGTSHSPASALNTAITVMATVCGWVVLFRVLLAFLKRWIFWILPAAVQVAVTGILELSNGCCELLSVPDVSARFCICSGLLAFGGLCVTMQTVSVTAGLSMKPYFLGKLLQTLFSLALAGLMAYGIWLPFGVLSIGALAIKLKAAPRNCVCESQPSFCPTSAVPKMGNTYSIPPFSEL